MLLLPTLLSASGLCRRKAAVSIKGAMVLLALGLAGCGTYVPRLTERVDVSDELAADLLVQAIVRSVRCELRNGVTAAINDDRAPPTRTKKHASDFLDKWGAEVALTLTIVEKGTVAPSTLLTPSSVVSVAAGVSANAKATRLEKINLFYTIRELYLRKGQTCDATGEDPSGSFLVRNDLKIADILRSRIDSIALGQSGAPLDGHPNAIVHQVTFQTVFDANVTPTIKLTRATVNPSGQLLDASRDRTHDLLITFGPTKTGLNGTRSLIAIAEEAHTIAQINSGFRTVFPQTP